MLEIVNPNYSQPLDWRVAAEVVPLSGTVCSDTFLVFNSPSTVTPLGATLTALRLDRGSRLLPKSGKANTHRAGGVRILDFPVFVDCCMPV